MVYALKDKKYFQFSCVSVTREQLEDKIEKAHTNWKAAKSRSAPAGTKTKEVFLSGYIKVSITIDRI